ncbi:MAG: efflux RND transporter periplasmic adaptor subunit [bacterium]
MTDRPLRHDRRGWWGGRCGRATLAWVLMISLGAAGTAGCNKAKSSAAATKKGGPPELPTVSVVKPERTAGGEVILGTIVASRQITITPQATGRIRKIHAKLGDFVKEGAPLVTLDPADANLGMYQASASAAVAKAAVRVAQTALANAWNDYQRFKPLYESKTIPKATFDKIKTGWLMAKAQVNLAQKQLQLAQSGSAAAYKNRKDTVTRAPFSGYVTRVMMYKGDMVRSMPPSHVMVFADVTPVVVEASIGELSLSGLPKPGQTIKLVIPGLGNKVLTPKMGRIMPALNAMTRSATLRIELPNADHALKLGLTVEIQLESGESNQLSLPLRAVRRTKGGAEVFRVRADGLLERVSVTLGSTRGSRVVVRNGLEATDQVVSDAAQPGLAVGSRVRASADL